MKEHFLNDFSLSHDCIRNFKRRLKICSRKITKFITRRQVENQNLINQSADSFLTEARKMVQNQMRSFIFVPMITVSRYTLKKKGTLPNLEKKFGR